MLCILIFILSLSFSLDKIMCCPSQQLMESIQEGMNVLVVGQEMVTTLAVSVQLEMSDLRIITPSWQKGLWHSEFPTNLTVDQLKGAVFLFDDPTASICRMKRKGTAKTFFKSYTNVTTPYSDLTFIKAMFGVFKSWTSQQSSQSTIPVIRLHLSDALNPQCMKLLGNALGVELKPISSLPNVETNRCSELDAWRDDVMVQEMMAFESDCKVGEYFACSHI